MQSAWLGLAAVVFSCTALVAQQAAPPGGQPAGGQRVGGQQLQPVQGGQTGNSDQQIAAVIYGACHNEVEIAKFAQSRLQSPEAKQFAEKMIKDHTPDCEAYQRLAGNLASGHQTPARAGGALDWVSIHQQIGQQCLESAKEELSKKQGLETDHCFMGQQLAAHMATKDKLEVLRKHSSPQLAQQIDQSLQVVNAHLKDAHQIMEQLKDRPSERVSRRPDGNK